MVPHLWVRMRVFIVLFLKFWTAQAFVPNSIDLIRKSGLRGCVDCSFRTNHNRVQMTAENVGGPATLERPEVQRRECIEKSAKERSGNGSEVWDVRIFNDDINTCEHVARMLVQVTGLTELAAYRTMMQSHENGRAVVGRYVYEIAEMYDEALKNNGIICDFVPVEEDFA